MSFGPLPAGLQPYTAEDFEQVLRPNGHRPAAPKLGAPEPIPQPDLLLRVRRLTWTAAALSENDESVRAALIRAWDVARSLALRDAPPTRPRFRLPGPLNRLLGGNSR